MDKEAKIQAKRAKTIPNAHDGYTWMPASATYNPYAGFGMFVRYKKSKNQHNIVIKEMSPQRVWVICPDREIYMSSSFNHDDTFWPSGFDEFINLNLLDGPVSRSLGLKYVMPNFVHCRGKNASADNREFGRKTECKNSNVTILSDSGGFQFSTGVVDMINPVELIDWYSRNVDAGMVLDVPITISDKELIKRAADLQRRNNNILLSLKPDHVDLVNILHGVTMDDVRRYREVIEDSRIPRLAIGGMYRYSLVSMCDYIWEITRTGQRYSQYHLLGFSSTARLPLLVALANLGPNPPHITSDSTTHIQIASNREYLVQLNGFGKRTGIGMVSGVFPNTGRHLPCQCPVCRNIKYADVLAYLPSHIVKQALSYHNIFEMNRLVEMLQDAIRNLKHHEFIQYVVKNVATNKGEFVQNLKPAIDFVYTAADSGIEAARSKYKSLLNISNVRYSDDKKVGLFGNTEGKSFSSEKDRLMGIVKQMEKQATDFEAGKKLGKTKKNAKATNSRHLSTMLS